MYWIWEPPSVYRGRDILARDDLNDEWQREACRLENREYRARIDIHRPLTGVEK
jgi:hypothetical protein